MRQIIASIIAVAISVASASAGTVSFKGNTLPPVTIKPDNSTGLNALYVLDNTAGVTVTYTASQAEANVQWQRYGNLGGGYAEDITATTSGKNSSVVLTGDDMGFIVTEGTTRTYFWVTNYNNHRLVLGSIAPAEEQDCGIALLNFTGNATEIPYYSINGRRCILSRDLKLTYNTLEFDETSGQYIQKQVETEHSAVGSIISTLAPLCDTEFTLSGDRFLSAWGEEQHITSVTFVAQAVEAETNAFQDQTEIDNQKKGSTDGLGGSAPAEIEFSATVTDAAIFREWQISRDSEFEEIDLRFPQLDFSYTFREEGNSYVRFVANNAAGTCEFISQTYLVSIGQSALDVPNAFSPGASEGVNDIWKVSYRSIVSFECHIFNKWGQQICSFKDPSQGWDGKYKGKVVPPGVYYYVIKAVGADGKKYDRAGDINVVGFRIGAGSGSGSGEPSAPSGDGGE